MKESENCANVFVNVGVCAWHSVPIPTITASRVLLITVRHFVLKTFIINCYNFKLTMPTKPQMIVDIPTTIMFVE